MEFLRGAVSSSGVFPSTEISLSVGEDNLTGGRNDSLLFLRVIWIQVLSRGARFRDGCRNPRHREGPSGRLRVNFDWLLEGGRQRWVR